MIKDKFFKGLLIPALGITIPLAAGLVSFQLTAIYIFLSFVYFICVSQLTWQGAVKIFAYLRTQSRLRDNIFFKLFALCVATVAYGSIVILLSCLVWQFFVFKQIIFLPIGRAVAIGAIAVLVLTLIYETLFLNVELELERKVLQQLDNERMQAEMNVLQNELDPHFLFNCLNTLSYLVRNDEEKAYQFVHKLSNVFKYFLINKQKDLVPLATELRFLEDYYFLLQVRFEEGIQIKNTIETADDVFLLPCTLQALVENAIKHNFFSDKEPLYIEIIKGNHSITVCNIIRPKKSLEPSTKIGLANLKARYRLVMNKNILVQTTGHKFFVRVPFSKTPLPEKRTF